MAPKCHAEELFNIHKKARTSYVPSTIPHSTFSAGVEGAPPPSPPDSPIAESSTAHLQREAVENFKKFAEFEALLADAEVKGLVEGFYACRGWINFHHPLFDLSRYAFFIIPMRFCVPLHGYLEETEATIERRRFEEDAQRAAGLDVPDPEDLSSSVPRH